MVCYASVKNTANLTIYHDQYIVASCYKKKEHELVHDIVIEILIK